MDSVTLSLIGICIALVLMLFLIMKGVNIFLVVLICVTIVAVTGHINFVSAIGTHFMTGFVGFLRANFLVFFTGTLLGKMMTVTKAGKSIARSLIRLFGTKYAIISVPLSCGILGYGGVTAFVISFCVFPIALQIFKEADIPRRFMPGALTFGCSTFAMIAPGALQIHNSIPANILETNLTSGMIVGFISCGVMLFLGSMWLLGSVKRAKAKGEGFIAKPMDIFAEDDETLPHWFIALIPLIATVILVNIPLRTVPLLHDGVQVVVNGIPQYTKAALMNLETGLFSGSVIAYLLMYRFQDKTNRLTDNILEICRNSMRAIVNTCAVIGFGTVVQQALGFKTIIDGLLNFSAPPLVGVAVIMNIIAGICGSASGALGIATPIIKNAYAGLLSPQIIHRTLSVASSAMDSLPHNGYIITVTNIVCNETHKNSYGLTFMLTVVAPLIGTAVCVALFTIFPNWP